MKEAEALECGGSTPPCFAKLQSARRSMDCGKQSGVEPPHSKTLRAQQAW